MKASAEQKIPRTASDASVPAGRLVGREFGDAEGQQHHRGDRHGRRHRTQWVGRGELALDDQRPDRVANGRHEHGRSAHELGALAADVDPHQRHHAAEPDQHPTSRARVAARNGRSAARGRRPPAAARRSGSPPATTRSAPRRSRSAETGSRSRLRRTGPASRVAAPAGRPPAMRAAAAGPRRASRATRPRTRARSRRPQRS